MKKYYTLLLVSVSLAPFSQTLTPTVVGSSGDFYSGTAASLSWTLGEVVTDTYIGTNNQLTQGFQQPEIKFSIIEDLAVEIILNLYPNPTTGAVSFEVKNNTEVLNIQITDATGKLIYSEKYLPESTHQIDLSLYARGIYFMQLLTESDQKIKTVKIEKI